MAYPTPNLLMSTISFTHSTLSTEHSVDLEQCVVDEKTLWFAGTWATLFLRCSSHSWSSHLNLLSYSHPLSHQCTDHMADLWV